jgi:hypothetical protein
VEKGRFFDNHEPSHWSRLVRAARLDAGLYEELEHDRAQTRPAIGVVVLASFLQAAATWAASHLPHTYYAVPSGRPLAYALLEATGSVLGFFVGAAVIYLVGTHVFKGTAEYGQIVRTMGFAYAPMLLTVLYVIPYLGLLIIATAYFWAFIATIVAVREALDLPTGRSLATVLFALVLYSIAFVLVAGNGSYYFGAH